MRKTSAPCPPISGHPISGPLIAVFGGAFDPPHYGHLIVIGALLNVPEVSSVWLVPSRIRSDKQCHATPAQRLKMVQLFASEVIAPSLLEAGRVAVRDDEVNAPHSIEGTVELLDLISVQYPGADFVFVVGSDLLSQLPRWRHQARLRADVKLFCVTRPGTTMTVPEGFHVTFIPHMAESMITSTLCRQSIQEGRDCTSLMPPSILRYISEHKLYKSRN